VGFIKLLDGGNRVGKGFVLFRAETGFAGLEYSQATKYCGMQRMEELSTHGNIIIGGEIRGPST